VVRRVGLSPPFVPLPTGVAMAQIRDPLPAGPTTEEELGALERHIGHPLPADYRKFLLQYNGGHPDPDAFLVDDGYGEQEDIVMCLFPMRKMGFVDVAVQEHEELRIWPLHCAWDDLQRDLEVHCPEVGNEEPVLPIGTDGSGNYFCIVLQGARTGAVVFLEHEAKETFPLADNFNGFIGSLRPRKRTDYAL
jgi:hypothetical protein